jgi:hypothetical protein
MSKTQHHQLLARAFVFNNLSGVGAKKKSDNLTLLFPQTTVTLEEFTSVMQQLVPLEYYQSAGNGQLFFSAILENLFGKVPTSIPVQVFASKWMGREYSRRTTKTYRRKVKTQNIKTPSPRCSQCGHKLPTSHTNAEETHSEDTQ